mgnify:CR=1 FL=1|jgi:hypothetical protein
MLSLKMISAIRPTSVPCSKHIERRIHTTSTGQADLGYGTEYTTHAWPRLSCTIIESLSIHTSGICLLRQRWIRR